MLHAQKKPKLNLLQSIECHCCAVQENPGSMLIWSLECLFLIQKETVKREIGVRKSDHAVPATVNEGVFTDTKEFQIPLSLRLGKVKF